MDFQTIVKHIDDVHCGACKFGLAKKALTALQDGETIAIPNTPPLEKPKPAPAKKQRRILDPDARTRTEKSCNNCGHVKPLSAYPRNKSCADGYTGTCKACTYERQRKAHKASSQPAPKLDSKFHCKPCHGVFLTQQALDNHNCIG